MGFSLKSITKGITGGFQDLSDVVVKNVNGIVRTADLTVRTAVANPGLAVGAAFGDPIAISGLAVKAINANPKLSPDLKGLGTLAATEVGAAVAAAQTADETARINQLGNTYADMRRRGYVPSLAYRDTFQASPAGLISVSPAEAEAWYGPGGTGFPGIVRQEGAGFLGSDRIVAAKPPAIPDPAPVPVQIKPVVSQPKSGLSTGAIIGLVAGSIGVVLLGIIALR